MAALSFLLAIEMYLKYFFHYSRNTNGPFTSAFKGR
jgi:hypothetical protein